MVSALRTPSVLGAGAGMASGIGRLHASREPGQEVRHDAFRGASIPELGYPSSLAIAGEDCVNTLHDERPISSDQDVSSLLDRDRTLGVLAHRQARHAERGGL